MSEKQIIRYKCPFCIYSTWNKNEDYEGEALQNVKDHVKKFHDRTDCENLIKETEVQ